MKPNPRFICQPHTLSMDVNITASGARHILQISLSHSKSVGFTARYPIPQMTKEALEKKVKKFCNSIIDFTEEEIQQLLPASNIMSALFAKRRLEEVKNAGGGLIWRRP